jgi:hypothetical protein
MHFRRGKIFFASEELKRWSTPMKTKSLLFIVAVWFLSLGGTVQAQQEKERGDMAGAGRSPAEYDSYMGGKEHYLPDSPNYMAGKEHYLRGGSFSKNEKVVQGNEQIQLRMI